MMRRTCSSVTGWPLSVAPVDVTGIVLGWISCSFWTWQWRKKLNIFSKLANLERPVARIGPFHWRWTASVPYFLDLFDFSRFRFFISLAHSLTHSRWLLTVKKWKTRISRIGRGVGSHWPIRDELGVFQSWETAHTHTHTYSRWNHLRKHDFEIPQFYQTNFETYT